MSHSTKQNETPMIEQSETLVHTTTPTANRLALSRFLENCKSITATSLSLKTIAPFQDVNSAIQQELGISNWLGRQTLDYTSFSPKVQESSTLTNTRRGTNESNNKTMTDEVTTQDRTFNDQDFTQLQTEWLERTSDQYLQHLLIRRIRMGLSAQAALSSTPLSLPKNSNTMDDANLVTLTHEALQRRDEVADRVTKLQYQLMQVRDEQQTLTRQLRSIQGENRQRYTLLKQSNCRSRHHRPSQQSIATSGIPDRGMKLNNDATFLQNKILRLVLTDLIIGTDLMYKEERIAQTLLKLSNPAT